MRTERRWCTAARSLTVAAAALVTASTGAAAPLGAQEAVHGPPAHEMDWGRTTFVLAEVLEIAPKRDPRPLLFDLLGWTGGPVHRIWFKADGIFTPSDRRVVGSYELLYGRMISPFWDLQLGARADLFTTLGRTESRVGAVVGVQGLAPGWFELEPSLFVASDGDLFAGITGSYDLYVTQRLVMQPRAELAVAARAAPEFGHASGLTDGSLALRLRYEFKREFAPYVGVLVERSFGRTADLARAAGGDAGETLLVFGLRLWR